MKNMRLAVALGSMFWISNVFATIVSYNITVSSDSWSNSGVLPYGVAEQPTFSGTFKVDTGLPASSNVIDLNMVTGSQTWTQATLGSTSSLYPMVGGQGLLLGAGSGLGRLDISVASSANINSFMLTDPKSGAIQCQNCVSFSPTSSVIQSPRLAPVQLAGLAQCAYGGGSGCFAPGYSQISIGSLGNAPNGFQAIAEISAQGDRIVLAIAGTQPSDPNDLRADTTFLNSNSQ